MNTLYGRNARNNNSKSSSSGFILRIALSILFIILALVALYYLHKYIYGKPTGSSVELVGFNGPKKISLGIGSVSTDPAGSTEFTYNNTVSSLQFSPIVDGGQYSVSLWVYVQKVTNVAKPILRIGPDSGNDTLRVYLDANSNILRVRTGTATTSGKLESTDRNTPYKNTTSNTNSCDITNFDYQRWVHITVVLNTNVTDVFIDGKLARSSLNDSSYVVSSAAKLKVNEIVKEGSGAVPSGYKGYLSNIVTYNYALSPDEIYRNYMRGPDATYSVWTYLLSFFNPNSYGEGVTGIYA